MSPILVMLKSHSHSDFERSNISFKENKPDVVDLNFNGLTTAFERTRKKFYGFRQSDLIHQLFVIFVTMATELLHLTGSDGIAWC